MKKLERSLPLTSVIAISIGGMLGSGIFVLPGIAAAKTGPSVWLAYLLAAVFVLPAVLSKSELATAMPSTGGTYVFIERALGPLMGTISGIGLWLSLLLKSAFALIGCGAYLLILTELPTVYMKYLALLFLLLIMLINLLGVKKVGKVQIVIVSLSVLGLIFVLLFGLQSVQPELLKPAFTHGSYGLVSTIAFVYISYAGVTKIAAIAGEIKNPSRNLPFAMILSLILITTIYVLVTFALVGNISIEELKTDIKPIYTIANLLGGQHFGYAAGVLGVITLFSMANSGVLASSRFPFAMAQGKLLPEFLNKIHPKYLTPVATIVSTCFTMAIVILFLDVEKIVKLASAFMVAMFILQNFCVIILRETAVQWYNPTFRAPFYPFVQIFGILSGAVLLLFCGWLPILSIFIAALIGIIIYFFYGSRKTERTGVLKRYGHRPALYMLYKRKNQNGVSSIQTKEPLDIKSNKNIAPEAGVVVPLLGNERSPEMLAEISASINSSSLAQTVHITEVPDQTDLDAVMEENPIVLSLSRRIASVAKSRKVQINFEAVVTHDLSDTIHTLSDQTHCEWLVMGWNGRSHNGILVSNPIGWLVTNINSNFALFKDNGVRHISKIVLALRPGRQNSHFIQVAERICLSYKASLTLLHVVPEDCPAREEKIINQKALIELSFCKSEKEVVIVRSDDPVEAIAKHSASYDLLIIGTPEKDNWINILFGTGKDKYAESSACSVLRLTIKHK